MAYPMTYTNHLGDSVAFSAGSPYRYNETDLRSAEWSAEDLNGAVATCTRKPRDYELEAFVNGAAADCTAFDDVFEADARANVDGTLEAGGWKLACRRVAARPASWAYVEGYMRVSLTLHSARPVWWRDAVFTLAPPPAEREGGAGYPHGFPHGYGAGARNRAVVADANGESDFLLRVFGPCSNPRIRIGSNVYGIDLDLREGERAEIDTRDKTALHVAADGTEANAFSRLVNGMEGSGHYAFQKLARGESAVTWSGSHSVDVVVHEERSAPAW